MPMQKYRERWPTQTVKNLISIFQKTWNFCVYHFNKGFVNFRNNLSIYRLWLWTCCQFYKRTVL